MRPLSAHEIVGVWERGLGQAPLERALTLASAAGGGSRADLATLPVGERDRRVLALRAATLGDRLDAYAECPRCAERLAFRLRASDLLGETLGPPDANTFEHDGWTVRFRPVNSLDLAAALEAGTAGDARRALLAACVLDASHEDAAVRADALPEPVAAHLAERLAACDPAAEVALDLTCPTCAARWTTVFDVAAFVWDELAALARRLLREVHALARAYGWCEADVLALSAARRAFYLDLAA